MSFPFTIHIGSFSLTLHAVLETMAFFVGFRYFLYLRRRQGDRYTTSNRIWILIGATFGALLGSRLLGILERPGELMSTTNFFEYLMRNKTVVGGFLGGLFGVELTKKLLKERTASGDLFVYPMILGLIIGRIGCFSMGVYEETYGLPTTAFTGMNLGHGLLRHPVCLYEISFLVVLWTGLKMLERKSLQNGAVFKLFMIAYISFRFLLEFIKPHVVLPVGLSSIQVACLLGLVWYLPFLLRPKKLLDYA